MWAPGSKPVPLSEEEVERLGVESKQLEVSYKAGDAVSIIGWPLEGFSGRVESIDLPNNVVKVIVSMFGRETAVELACPRCGLRNNGSGAACGRSLSLLKTGGAPLIWQGAGGPLLKIRTTIILEVHFSWHKKLRAL